MNARGPWGERVGARVEAKGGWLRPVGVRGPWRRAGHWGGGGGLEADPLLPWPGVSTNLSWPSPRDPCRRARTPRPVHASKRVHSKKRGGLFFLVASGAPRLHLSPPRPLLGRGSRLRTAAVPVRQPQQALGSSRAVGRRAASRHQPLGAPPNGSALLFSAGGRTARPPYPLSGATKHYRWPANPPRCDQKGLRPSCLGRGRGWRGRRGGARACDDKNTRSLSARRGGGQRGGQSQPDLSPSSPLPIHTLSPP